MSEVYAAASATISIDPSVDINIAPTTGESLARGSTKINVKTQGTTNYILTMSSQTSKDLLGTANSGRINSIATNGVMLNNFDANTFGYCFGATACTDADNYNAPSLSPTQLTSKNLHNATDDLRADDDYYLTFGAKINQELGPDTYTGTYLLSLTANDYTYSSDFATCGGGYTWQAAAGGIYRIELWGAQGASSYGARGGYTAGDIELARGQYLYFYIGCQAEPRNVGGNLYYNGIVFNGTGLPSAGLDPTTSVGTSGGGATDVRIVPGGWSDLDSLKGRIMVAAGGGGSRTGNPNDPLVTPHATGVAGGLWGEYGDGSASVCAVNGGTQTSGGITRCSAAGMPSGGFGFSGYYNATTAIGRSGGGGGGGYYGGVSGNPTTNYQIPGAGSGGSSFISGHLGCDAITEGSTSTNIIHTGQPNHYSGLVFANTKMVGGDGYSWTTSKDTYTGMPNHAGNGTMVGNSGHGYAKITYL